jgi:hypothetical protein
MNPRIGKRAKSEASGPKLKVQLFVEQNTHYAISIQREYMYIEDSKTAINLGILEQRIETRKELVRMLNNKLPPELIIKRIDDLNDMDHHRIVKLTPNYDFKGLV